MIVTWDVQTAYLNTNIGLIDELFLQSYWDCPFSL